MHIDSVFSLSLSVASDGAGRSGTYILIDMVLNKMAKGENQKACFFFFFSTLKDVLVLPWKRRV